MTSELPSFLKEALEADFAESVRHPPNMGDLNYQIRKSHSGSIALRFDDEWGLLWVADDDLDENGNDPLEDVFTTWDVIYPNV
ncbi:hypothetical protein [Mycobacteroides abscessus]|uniref:hypothetical protein n=1 Tax=Mycobacteroides abscessus TaxID=36809 RepID=UPI0009A71C36|nr:hypothetical protein [Mycobacteroides abscessus]RIU09640.1 hypothetical protein D2E94_11060 [Mycobacteroides abscessus]SLF57849.1 Uncharacterised protein [Mycobacteroides abscessus subsp. abscessus]